MRVTASKSNNSKPPHSKPSSKHPPAIEQVACNTSPFQRREWIVQRIGWAVLALLLLAGALGVFGKGPLADQSLSNATARLDYERFVRRDADTRWTLTLHRTVAGSTAQIAIDATLASNFEIVSIHPTPSSTALSAGRWVYSFDVRESGEVPVIFIVQPEKVGRHGGTITVGDAAPFTISQLAYP
jgi:hypothetical protein